MNYDLMLTLRNAFSIFIIHKDVIHLSDIKSYNHPTAIYNHPTTIYICPTAMTTLYGWNSSQTYRLYCYCNSVNYDLMLTLTNAFSIFISHKDVMHLSDIKSYNHPTTKYNHPTAIYIQEFNYFLLKGWKWKKYLTK